MIHKIILLSIFMLIAFSGCTSVLETKITTVDERNVEYYLKQNNSPTIVIENGLDGTMQLWSKVIPSLENNLTVFAYNRAGYGNSALSQSPRDGEHIVEELRLILRHNNLKPPYILVGHSLGGLYMQYYARKYPDETQALILVDSTHPNQLDGQGAYDSWPFLAKVLFNTLLSDTAKDEFDALDETGKEVLALPTVSTFPVIVLSALEPMSENSALANDSNTKRIDIINLYPTSEQYWIESGHVIPYEKPEAVIEAIRTLVKPTLQ